MEIKILGTGCCSACGELYGIMQKKAKELGIDAVVTKSDDMMEIMAAGVMSTPAVVIDGKVVHAGGLPKAKDIDGWFSSSASCCSLACKPEDKDEVCCADSNTSGCGNGSGCCG